MLSIRESVTRAVSPPCCGGSRPGYVRSRRAGRSSRSGPSRASPAASSPCRDRCRRRSGSSSRARRRVSGRMKPLSRAKITEVRSLWVCSSGPTSISSTMACIAQPCGVSPIFSCCAHSSGTERASATMCFSTAILRSIAWRGAPDNVRGLLRQRADEFGSLLGEQFDGVGGEQLVVADRGRDARVPPCEPRLRHGCRCRRSRTHRPAPPAPASAPPLKRPGHRRA